MKHIHYLATTCLAIFAMSSCSIQKKNTTVATGDDVLTKPVTQIFQAPPALVGEWSVVNVGGTEVVAQDDQYPTVSFDNLSTPAGIVNMVANDGCNYINGSFAVNGDKLVKSGEFTKTMRLCPDAKYEMQITNALNAVSAFSIELNNNEYSLLLKDDAGTTLMTLCKANLAFFDGAWRVIELDGATLTEGHAPEIVIDLSNGKIHGNAGCNVVNGSINQNLDFKGGVEFSNLFTTMMACPYLSTERAFLVALEQVVSCVPGENTNIAVLKDASEKTLITLERIELTQK